MFTIILFLLTFFPAPDCASAFSHKHDRLKDTEMVITSWSGCSVNGTINGTPVTLFMDVASCPLHAKIPGAFRIRFDQTCGAILEITDGPAITTPMPPSCATPTPTPTPTPSPTPTPTPSPTPSPSPTPVTTQCVLSAPAAVTVPRNGTGSVSVLVTDLGAPVTVSAVSNTPGQVSVSPASRLVTGTSSVVAFSLRAKKNSTRITFSSPCGSAVTMVNVR